MKKKKKIMILIVLLIIFLPILYSLNTKNPAGTDISSEFKPADCEFLYDLTYLKDGKRIHQQKIFNREMETIKNAQKFLMIDFFLFNDEYDKSMDFPNQVEKMTDLLIAKKKENPEMPILFVTDPINNFYGAYEENNLKKLRENGIYVVVTDLNKMRDSNVLISGGYRAYVKWFGTSGSGWIKNFFDKDAEKVNVRSILKLSNFKGNHRKVVISEKEALIASANPHDPSAYHSNVAMVFRGKSMEDLIKSESIFFDKLPNVIENFKAEEITSPYKLKIITEGKIYEEISKNIRKTKKGDEINLGMFYLSEFRILKDLGEASKRGAYVKIIADLNKDAFGLEKNGTPNRPALSELKEDYPDINIRWYQTSGEQFHTKFIYFKFKDKNPLAILGSANYTRRNLDNFNLETDLAVEMEKNSTLPREMEEYFSRIWNNENGEYTLPLEKFYENRFLIRLLWKIQEKTGLCTW
ncbi:MAG: phospholipase D-like domain-containing protein [Peptoniphilus sp.]|uniref:phospholipase D-like domain-containing protein n=1 Tax=Peptoniphilus sp. TaxID=1971214 RepID=UPI0025D97394|nr:phospholipase D-like domain-containing protein [Peptoniphilus sp.]MCI5643731.1 phospholipase D-like domain-containing protein [Peptoniphilus sp.]MDD7352237.1 phospholipase D-like domain-containing protein [Peptoniphilaceae bacterium]